MSMVESIQGERASALPSLEPLEPRLLFNAAPYANDYFTTAVAGTSVLIDPTLNDTDVDGDALSVSAILLPPGSGTAVVENGKVRFTASSILGNTPFIYQVTDGKGGFDSATIHVNVVASDLEPPANRVPVAVNDTASTTQNASVLIDVLSNDSDPDGDPITIAAITPAPASGTATIESNRVRYVPATGFTGDVTFGYQISDGRGGTATATVSVSVAAAPTGPNTAPYASDDTGYSVAVGQSILIDPTLNDTDADGDPLFVSAIPTPPGAGTAVIENGKIRFTPSTVTGMHPFIYRVSDGRGGTDTATIYVNVVSATTPPTNQSPVAVNDTVTTTQNTSVLINVLANDSDPDGDVLTLAAITSPPPANAGVAAIENNQIRFTPTSTFTGAVNIGYQISDGRGGIATATAAITVIASTGPNTAPYAYDDTGYTVAVGQSILIDPTLNDTDADGDPLAVIAIPTPPGAGTAVIEDGKIRFTPSSITGMHPFIYRVGDGRGGADTATIYVNVVASASAGTLAFEAGSYTVNEHDGTVAVAVVRTGGSSGSVSVNYATTNLTATAGQDYTANSGSLTFAAGITRLTITIPILNDPTLEGEETFRVALTNPTGGATLGAQATTTVAIRDNDGVPGGTRVVVIGSSTVEGAADRNSFRRPLGAALSQAGYAINFVGTKNLSAGVAPPNLDYDRDHEGYAGWRADEVLNGRSGVPALATRLAGLSADGDQLTPDIALLYVGHNDIFQGQSPQNVRDDLAQIIAVLRADNPGVTVLVGKLAPSAWDGGIHNANIAALNALIDDLVVTMDAAASRVVAVDLYAGFDTSVYTTDGQHPNAAGEAFMADRWFAVMKQAIDGTLPPPPTSVNAGTLALESSTYVVDETAGSITIAVVRTGGSDGTVSIDYSTVEGSATVGQDYQYTEGTVTLGPGVTRATFTIPILNDALAEGNETFGVSLNRVTGGADLSQPRTATITIIDDDGPAPIGTGDGLKGVYHDNINFTGTQVTRVDPSINFNWATAAPVTGIAADTFSVRWTGQIEARYSELFTFTTTSDDGIRLWVNGQLIIDQWNDHSATNHSGVIGMIAGQRVDIRIDYYENTGSAVAQLRWVSPSQVQQIVPTSQLYSTGYTGQIDGPALLNPVTVYSGLTQPTALSFTPNGLTFIAQKNGIVRVAQNGALIATPFIDIRGEVNDVRDRGLLGLAVHPNFPATPYVYLLYTYDPPETIGRTGFGGPDGAGARGSRLMRVTADAANDYRTAVAGSAVVILGTNSTWEHFGAPTSSQSISNVYGGLNPDGTYVRDSIPIDSESHTIGALAFLPDGSLLVTSGDGTSYGAVDPKTARVQDVNSLNGKVLRIDPITGQGLSDNPFFDGDPGSNRSKVYALGFRNPFRLTVDPLSGRAYVGDVGWNTWEELNQLVPGGNYGWPWYEGGNGTSVRTPGYRDLAAAQAFYNSGIAVTAPVWARSHTSGGVAIVAGDFYTGAIYSASLAGTLFVSDYGVPAVDAIRFNADGSVQSVTRVASSVGVVVEMTMGPDGYMYFVDITGRIARLAVP